MIGPNNWGGRGLSGRFLARATETDADAANVKCLLGFDSSSTPLANELGASFSFSASGGAARSTARRRYGDASFAFDGSGDYVTGSDASLSLSSADYVAELYFLRRSFTDQCLITSWSVQANARMFVFALTNGTVRFGEQSANGTNDASIYSTVTLPLWAWHHVAAVKSGTTLRLYLNWRLAGTVSSADRTNHGTQIRLGAFDTAGTARYLDGYLDEVRLTVGTDRGYSDNWIPQRHGPYPRS